MNNFVFLLTYIHSKFFILFKYFFVAVRLFTANLKPTQDFINFFAPQKIIKYCFKNYQCFAEIFITYFVLKNFLKSIIYSNYNICITNLNICHKYTFF